VTIDVSKTTGYAVHQNTSLNVSKATGYAVLVVTDVHVSKTTGYAVLGTGSPEEREIRLSKATGYGVLRVNLDLVLAASKTTGYGVLRGTLKASKVTAYSVMDDPTPRKINLSKATGYAILGRLMRLSKTTGYSVLQPGPDVVRVSKATGYIVGYQPTALRLSDVLGQSLSGGNPALRLSTLSDSAAQSLTDGVGDLRNADNALQPLTGGEPELRCSDMVVQILHGVPEVPTVLDPATQQAPFSGGVNGLIGITMSVTKAPNFSTRIADVVSGREVRNAFFDDPKWDFTISFDYLPDRPVPNGYSQLKKLEGWYMKCRGSFASWLFQDPDDYTTEEAVQGLTDGVTLQYDIRRDFGGFSERIGQLNTALPYEFWFETTEGEPHTVPISAPYDVSVDSLATFRNDISVKLDGGAPLVKVDVAPGPMQYVVDDGVYTFNAAQSGEAILISYGRTLTEGSDYTVLMPNKVVFPEAVEAGWTLKGSMAFYFVCRFSDDMADFEKFMDKLWELQQLSFRSVIQ